MRRVTALLLSVALALSMSAMVYGEDPMDNGDEPGFQVGEVIEVIDPHMEMHRFGRVVEVYENVAYGILFPGESEVHRWYVDFELRPATEDDLMRHEEGSMPHRERAVFEPGDPVEVIDPHMDMHRYGTVAEVYEEVAYGILFPGETEVHRWYVDFELKPASEELVETHAESMEGHTEPMDGHGH